MKAETENNVVAFGGNWLRPETIEAIAAAVSHARAKHPVFVTRKITFDKILAEEIGETAEAEIRGDEMSHRAELMDAIAVLVRKFEGDDKSVGVHFVKDEPETNRYRCDGCDWFVEGGLPESFGIKYCPQCGELVVGILEVHEPYRGE